MGKMSEKLMEHCALALSTVELMADSWASWMDNVTDLMSESFVMVHVSDVQMEISWDQRTVHRLEMHLATCSGKNWERLSKGIGLVLSKD